jgi:hypothetical protein
MTARAAAAVVAHPEAAREAKVLVTARHWLSLVRPLLFAPIVVLDPPLRHPAAR